MSLFLTETESSVKSFQINDADAIRLKLAGSESGQKPSSHTHTHRSIKKHPKNDNLVYVLLRFRILNQKERNKQVDLRLTTIGITHISKSGLIYDDQSF